MTSFNCNNNQVRDSCHGRSCSKAQAYLQKILHLISTIPPPCESNPNPFKNKRGFHLDLNLSSFSGDESEAKSESSAENSSFTETPDSEDEIEEKTGTEASSDVTEIQKSEGLFDSTKNGSNGEVKPAAGFDDSLDLLIEAAEMISDRDHGLKEKIREGEEVVEDRLVDVVGEDMSAPVVRSKRGRSQVLPRRFRDSVLEPWNKGPPRRSITAAAAMVSKRKKRRSK